ncbi:MAG: FtsW/RodA/SpoVE family cell cycle protein [Firmicutes bacterium]|nr:FtsW/RodA/SpoVE family cell cycle protein [Bacillota bacterium]
MSGLRRKTPDLLLLLAVLTLLGLGLIMVASASTIAGLTRIKDHPDPFYFIKRQLLYALVGLGAMVFMMNYDYHRLRRWTIPLALGTPVLLVLVLILGEKTLGAKRWIDLGFFNLQGSEVAKLAMVMVLEDRLQPLIERWDGRLVRAEADNLYAVFPDVTAAVRCAEAMVQTTNEANALLPPADDLFISVGIGYGDLLVVGDDLFGDEMNLASKLGEDLAQRDEILLTPAARAAVTASSWRFDELAFRVSGLELRAYRLVRRPSILRDGMPKIADDFVVRRAVPADGPFVREFVFATLRSYGIEPDPAGLDADVMAFGTAGDRPGGGGGGPPAGPARGGGGPPPRGGGPPQAGRGAAAHRAPSATG